VFPIDGQPSVLNAIAAAFAFLPMPHPSALQGAIPEV
jgi:hypothetical protein